MNKEQFKLQTQHNRYVRSAIAGICKIILWTDLYIFAMWLILSVFARIEASATTQALTSAVSKSSSSGSSDSTAGLVVVGLLILLCTVIYNWAVAHEIVDKVNQHRRLSTIEDEYFGVSTTKSDGVNDVSDDDETEVEDDDDESDDEMDDDML